MKTVNQQTCNGETRHQTWLGHKRIDETMIYVHVAENHRRDIPDPILAAAETARDPDRRIILMLGALK